jgi:KDO2-lipid IV(A) lauroyltransferase
VATELERFIAEHPAEWHVFQPFWKADREQARRQRSRGKHSRKKEARADR